MAESKCLALILALNRQVKETGRIDFPVTSITVIIKELKNAKKETRKVKNARFDGVVNEHSQRDTPLKFLQRYEEIKKSDTKKVKFRKDVVLFKPRKNSRLNEVTDSRNTKKTDKKLQKRVTQKRKKPKKK
jgi:hypothetical protein